MDGSSATTEHPTNWCGCTVGKLDCDTRSIYCNGGVPWRKVTFMAPRWIGWLIRRYHIHRMREVVGK